MAKKQHDESTPDSPAASVAPVVEQAVRFRFSQYCYSPLAEGANGEVRTLPADVAAALARMSVGNVIVEERQG